MDDGVGDTLVSLGRGGGASGAVSASVAHGFVVIHDRHQRAGSWPVRFTGPPLSLPAGGFGTGYGTGAHAPDEFFLIDSSDPKIAGMDQAALSFVRLLYQIAE